MGAEAAWKLFALSAPFCCEPTTSLKHNISLSLLKKILFLERWEGREKEKERNINVWLLLMCPLLGTWPATGHVPTGNQTGNLLVHRLELYPLRHTSQGTMSLFKSL